jgi:hypothetical protein
LSIYDDIKGIFAVIPGQVKPSCQILRHFLYCRCWALLTVNQRCFLESALPGANPESLPPKKRSHYNTLLLLRAVPTPTASSYLPSPITGRPVLRSPSADGPSSRPGEGLAVPQMPSCLCVLVVNSIRASYACLRSLTSPPDASRRPAATRPRGARGGTHSRYHAAGNPSPRTGRPRCSFRDSGTSFQALIILRMSELTDFVLNRLADAKTLTATTPPS